MYCERNEERGLPNTGKSKNSQRILLRIDDI